jgi:hypothetical protein
MTAVTPAEAADKLCMQMLPFIGSREPTRECMCRGPRCMSWRWLPDDVVAASELQRKGYCGLAGPIGERASPLAMRRAV